jgi:hypothetical protein
MHRRNDSVEMEQQGGNMDSVSTRTQRESEKGKDGVGETIDDELLAATTATRMASRRKGRALTVLFRASHAPHERARGEKKDDASMPISTEHRARFAL